MCKEGWFNIVNTCGWILCTMYIYVAQIAFLCKTLQQFSRKYACTGIYVYTLLLGIYVCTVQYILHIARFLKS